jgi:hypothetical protein
MSARALGISQFRCGPFSGQSVVFNELADRRVLFGRQEDPREGQTRQRLPRATDDGIWRGRERAQLCLRSGGRPVLPADSMLLTRRMPAPLASVAAPTLYRTRLSY